LKTNQLTYLKLIVIHILLAVVVFAFPIVSKIYGVLIPIIGFVYVFTKQNKNNEVLYVAGYLVGIEVLLRMTQGNFLNEYVKYSVTFFMLLGMYFSKFSMKSGIYFLFLLLLIPSLFISTLTLNLSSDFRKVILFYLSGPICLSFSAVYCYGRRLSFKQLNNILLSIALPILSTVCYAFLYAPSVKEVVRGTSSNFATSGGFGPNQVSTVLGLGFFIFFTRILLFSKTKKDLLINTLFTLFIAFRAIVTFSRGGVMTGIIMIGLLILILYWYSIRNSRIKLLSIIFGVFLVSIGLWIYSSNQTSGLIEKRYANQDGQGRVKSDRLGGREELIETEIKMFLENPLLGVGIGKNEQYRFDSIGVHAASHNEITRLLAEHGFLGVIAFLILFITPLSLFFNNKQNIYLLSFFMFWLLTINHAAMRLAAPAFIYALTLLSVTIEEK
jgi:O-antigen ligase